MATAQALQQALGSLARRSLGLEAALELLGTMLELSHPRLEDLLVASRPGALGAGGLLSLGELALHALQAAGELARLELTVPQAATQSIDLGAAIALEIDQLVFGFDAKSLLGVLALLDLSQLALDDILGVAPAALVLSRLRTITDGSHGSIGGDHLRGAPRLLLGVAQPLLQARHVRLERPHGRLSGLCAKGQRVLTGLGRTARATFGEQVALASASASFRA
jgi:hypothetical protein